MSKSYEYVVIGGGSHGLSIAYHLQKTSQSVAILEQYKVGHNNGSSHGVTRISRSAYSTDAYRDLNNISTNIYWPQMQKTLKSTLFRYNQFICLDADPKTYKKYESVALKKPEQFKFISADDLYMKYPHAPKISKLENNKPIVDTKAAVISAGEYVQKLGAYLKKETNVKIYEQTIVISVIKTEAKSQKQQLIKIITSDKQEIYAKKIVMACGRWTRQLFPQLKSLIFVNRQVPCYIKMKNPQIYTIGKAPSYFCHMLDGRLFYGVPGVQGSHYKLCEHIVGHQQYEGDQKRIQRLDQFCKQVFGEMYEGITKPEPCYYTMTKSQDFIMDWIDAEEKILICSCCSGHGFKFSPLIGKLGADLLTKNKSIKEFEDNRHLFQIAYHKGINLID